VPTLVDGDMVSWESNTILRYLSALHAPQLSGATPAEKTQVERWMDWQASEFNNSWRFAFQALVRKNPAFQDPVAIANSVQLFTVMVGIVDSQLGLTGAYMAGEQFTVADIPIGLAIHRWFSTPIPRPTFGNVDRYYQLLLDRSGFRRYGRDGGP